MAFNVHKQMVNDTLLRMVFLFWDNDVLHANKTKQVRSLVTYSSCANSDPVQNPRLC